MENNLFTYELEVVEDFYFSCNEQPHDNLANGNLDVYEPRVCYDENEQIYVEAVILINKRLVRLIDITVEQWLDLKFGDNRKVDKEIMEEVCDPSNVDFAKWLASKFSNHMKMDWYTKNALWLYWIRGDDEEVLTDEEIYDLEEEKVSEEKEIVEISRTKMNIFDFETPLYRSMNGIEKSRGLKKNHGWMMKLGRNLMMKYVMNAINFNSKVDTLNGLLWYEGLEDGDLKDEALKEKAILEGSWGHENREGKNFCSWLKECFVDQERFDSHGPMQDNGDDDIIGLDDYLIGQDATYYEDEEEEGFKERKRKLLGMPYLIGQDATYYEDEKEEIFKERKIKLLRMPYEKPPTFKSEKFEVIKYLLGPEEEYVSIKEYEYDIWLRTEESVSRIYEEIFHKKDEGWSVTHTK
ncbi:hypothetical protein Tco_1336543 [Tanacetum coccineum]